VSLAAALAIPVLLEDGTAFPHRSLILFITFVVILLTLVVQGLTLPYLIRTTGLFEGAPASLSGEEELHRVRHSLHAHTLAFLRERVDAEHPDHAGLRRIAAQWPAHGEADASDAAREQTKLVMLELLESQRQHLRELNRDPTIDDDLLRHEVYLIDLEEERLRMKM